MADFTIKKTVFLKAPAEHVWTFLTEKEKLAIWFHEGESDFREGGPYAVLTNSLGKEGTRLCWGDIIEYNPPNRLVHTFTHEGLGGAETRCEWTLVDVEGGTILTLEHSGFENAKDAFGEAADHDKGWDTHFVRLRQVTA